MVFETWKNTSVLWGFSWLWRTTVDEFASVASDQHAHLSLEQAYWEFWLRGLLTPVSRTVFVKILKRLSLSADLCIHSYWLSRLRQASQGKMIQSSALRLRHFKILTCPLLYCLIDMLCWNLNVTTSQKSFSHELWLEIVTTSLKTKTQRATENYFRANWGFKYETLKFP